MKNFILALFALLILSCEEDFTPVTFTLTVSVTPNNGGSVSPQSGEYVEGSTVTLRANSSSDFEFESWTGNLSGSENPLTIIMDSNKNITANFVVADSDGDGVNNSLDLCNDTPSGATVNQQGCSTSQIDSDGDGVNDNIDQDNNTREGADVDENGVMTSPIYLDSNGITIKAYDWAIIGDVGEINGEIYTVVSLDELKEKILNNQDVTKVCTSKITNMSNLFKSNTTFNQPIGNWDTSGVTIMSGMFAFTTLFNQPIGDWDTSNVTDMIAMFDGAEEFDQPIGGWDTSNVTSMRQMFSYSVFNQPIGDWDTSSVIDISNMFFESKIFNQPIGDWNTTNVTDMSQVFTGNTSFNQPLNNWNTTNVTTMRSMFHNATSFNQPLNNWNTANVTDMGNMFFNATEFNQPLNNWDVSSVNSMVYMFQSFPPSRERNKFNQPLGDWDVSNVLSFEGMFYNTNFNQPLDKWDISRSTSLRALFEYSDFNYPIGDWDTSNVTDMSFMFNGNNAFNQYLANWCVPNITSEPERFSTNSALENIYKPLWGNCPKLDYYPSLLSNVSRFVAGSEMVPGTLDISDCDWIPLFTDSQGNVAAASNFNNKTLILTHENYLTNTGMDDLPNNNDNFFQNYFGSNKKILLVFPEFLNDSSLTSFKNIMEQENNNLSTFFDPNIIDDLNLNQYDALIFYGGESRFNNTELNTLKTFIKNPTKTSLIIGLGWVWREYYSINETESIPLNLILEDLGVKFIDSSEPNNVTFGIYNETVFYPESLQTWNDSIDCGN